jgi:hypothetical protein
MSGYWKHCQQYECRTGKCKLFDETNRLLKETEQRNAELAVINSVQESLVARIDIQGIYELVGEKIREIFDAPGYRYCYLR